MKKSGIQVGKTYHNGKEGRFYQERTILDEGPQYVGYSLQEDKDCIQYRVTRKGEKTVAMKAERMTRQSFSTWAKGEVQS